MRRLTDFITKASWEDIIVHLFVIVDDAYQALAPILPRWRRRGPQPRFSDSEVITVSLIIDFWFGGNEELGLAFLRQYHLDLFPHLPSPSRFNERRRRLGLVMEYIRRYLLAAFHLLPADDPWRLVDSLPAPVCQYSHAPRCQTVTGPEYVGHVASKKSKFFGFRLQMTTTLDQVVDVWLLTPAARKDAKMLSALLESSQDLVLLADNAYHDPGEAHFLAQSRRIQIYALPRRDSRHPWPQAFRRLVRRLRLRIETAFSILTTTFHIQRLGARSLSGVITRIASRLLAYTLCFILAPLFLTGELQPATGTKTPN